MNLASNPKRELILKTGKDLFWKFGFKRVTVEEICKEAGISKMTYYKFFSNKKELATIILDDVFADAIARIRKLEEEHEVADKTLKKILQLKSEGVHGISKEFIKDLYDNPDAEMKIYIEEKSREMFAEVIGLYEQGKMDGWVREDLNIPFLIQFTQKAVEMISRDDMLNFFGSSEELIMEVTNLFVYGISPHK